jgi:hypothetical protein
MLFSNEMVSPVAITRSIRDEASFVQSPAHFRDQAVLCLEIAQRISDSQLRRSKICARAPPNILRVPTRLRDE